MSDSRFDEYVDAEGTTKKRDHSFVINQLLNLPNAYSPVVAAMYMRDYYESYYGIKTHQAGASKDIMPLIAYSDAEDTFETSYLRERMTRYRKSGVLSLFGVSWDRFIEMPTEYGDALIEESEFAVQEKAAETARLQAEINSTFGRQP